MGGFKTIRVAVETGSGEVPCVAVSLPTRGVVERGGYPALRAVGAPGDLLDQSGRLNSYAHP
jgi:hypothetical protein